MDSHKRKMESSMIYPQKYIYNLVLQIFYHGNMLLIYLKPWDILVNRV